MAKIIYENNDVEISIESIDNSEGKVNINGKNLMWISLHEEQEFINELTAILDKYRI